MAEKRPSAGDAARRLPEPSPAARAAILERLSRDRESLAGRFRLDPGATVGGLRELGDRHRGGQAVALVEFAGTGTGPRRLVYKPRSLAADLAYHSLLAWVGREMSLSFAAPRVLDRGSHGWCEPVEEEDCPDSRGVTEFYRRLGCHLCLSALLGARDVHGENVVAAGAHPVIVDLECLLWPAWQNPLETRREEDELIETMILPRDVLAGGRAYDFSALGADPAAPFPEGAPPASFRNRPRLDGKTIDFREHFPAFSGSFSDCHSLIVSRKKELLEDDESPLRAFLGIETRVVLRPTWFYLRLLAAESARAAPGRRERLARATAEGLPPELAAVARSEARDLEDLDVPIFHARTEGRRIHDSRGEAVLEFAGLSGWEAMRRRLEERYGEEDRARKLRLIEEAFAGTSRFPMAI